MLQRRLVLPFGLIAFLVFMRVLPYALGRLGMSITPGVTIYPWNASPMTAACLFGGAWFAQRRWAFYVPFLALVLGDLGIGLVSGKFDYSFYAASGFVYAGFAISVCLGLWLKRHRSAGWIACGALLAEVLFFVVTNFGDWVAFDQYPKTLAGLGMCYVAAIPFFKNGIVGTAMYTTAFFGGYALLEKYYPALRAKPLLAAE